MNFYSYVPVGDIASLHPWVRLLRSAPTLKQLLSDPSYDPEQTGLWAGSQVQDTGDRKEVTNQKTDLTETVAIAQVGEAE